jgi:hypothetical protein
MLSLLYMSFFSKHVARMGRRGMHTAKPEGKRPQGRPRRRWADNIKIDLREVEWVGVD